MKQTKSNRIGEVHISTIGEEMLIIEYFDSMNCTIKFIDGTIFKNQQYNNIKTGKIRNPSNLIYVVGYFGIGNYSIKEHNKIYFVWNHMLKRCYDIKNQLIQPTYVGCTVDERWHNFQVFAEWCELNFIQDYVLDKDILFKGNKIYGPDTCCFVPIEINNLFLKCDKNRGDLPIGVSLTKNGDKFRVKIKKFGKHIYLGTYSTPERAFNVYKINKEFYIQQMANRWKPKIPDIVYKSMINYLVEITD